MQRMVAVEIGEVLSRAAMVDGVEDGVAVAVESDVDTNERKKLEVIRVRNHTWSALIAEWLLCMPHNSKVLGSVPARDPCYVSYPSLSPCIWSATSLSTDH